MAKLTEEQKQQIIDLLQEGMSSRGIAKQVIGRESAKSTVNDFIARENPTPVVKVHGPVIKVIDVETSPELVYSFRRFKAFISPEQVVKRGHLLSYSSADLKTGEVEGKNLSHYGLFDIDHNDDWELCLELWHLLDEADIIIAHNGVKFDRAYINQRFAYHGMNPPSNYVVIDTLRAAKKQFALPSNALKELCLYFETENFKLDNEGFALWKACMEGDRDAFGRMQTYNDGDVLSLRDLYLKILAWIPQHPNVAAFYQDEKCRCPRCGSENVELEGKQYHTGVSSFDIIRCISCGGQSRSRLNTRTKEKRINTILPI